MPPKAVVFEATVSYQFHHQGIVFYMYSILEDFYLPIFLFEYEKDLNL